ncbi:MAG: hypothetical protein JNL62_21530, partial [Bryobacterales bacterium]|nr:hypothetical protein [Bryobacterales bacterium]
VYNHRDFPLQTAGNVYVSGARPYFQEPTAVTVEHPALAVSPAGALQLKQLANPSAAQVTTKLLGTTRIARLPYENPDGSPLTIDIDFFGRPRTAPTPGPFQTPPPQKLW